MEVPVIEITAPAACEALRDHRGIIIGRVETQHHTGKLVARDARGVVAGSYYPRLNATRDARRRVIGRGNLLGALLVSPRSLISVKGHWAGLGDHATLSQSIEEGLQHRGPVAFRVAAPEQ